MRLVQHSTAQLYTYRYLAGCVVGYLFSIYFFICFSFPFSLISSLDDGWYMIYDCMNIAKSVEPRETPSLGCTYSYVFQYRGHRESRSQLLQCVAMGRTVDGSPSMMMGLRGLQSSSCKAERCQFLTASGADFAERTPLNPQPFQVGDPRAHTCVSGSMFDAVIRGNPKQNSGQKSGCCEMCK